MRLLRRLSVRMWARHGRTDDRRRDEGAGLGIEPLESRVLLASSAVRGALARRLARAAAGNQTLTAAEVGQLLRRAAAASASNDAIIAVVDRGGNVLGVRVEAGVAPAITGNAAALTFAVAGALAEARTAALFANNTAPLTSRTIQFISQS